jgi:hypothetical protein
MNQTNQLGSHAVTRKLGLLFGMVPNIGWLASALGAVLLEK